MGGKEPMHANFATRISERISHRITLPLAVLQGVTGLGILLVTGRIAHLFETSNFWLDVAIVLYAITLYTSIFIQSPRVAKIIEMPRATIATTPGGAPSGRRPRRGGDRQRGRRVFHDGDDRRDRPMVMKRFQ
jgi:hypothetical protein